jgi:hypothetical protein
MATNDNDHAVVIGIRRYHDAADPSGWIGNLNGPDNDAAAVADWLREPGGGDLLDKNVRLIRSADLPDPFPDENGVGPQQRAVEGAFDGLADLSTTAYEGQYSGRRLYVYVSGHGFGRQNDEAALVTAEAKRSRPFNVLVTSWVDWFWLAGRFKEFVLWVDCCATRQPLTYLKPCDRNEERSPNADKGRRFSAFAAGFDKRAVENQIDGEWHGVFTYALLQGLNGAASGEVTTDSLRDYLRNSMATFMRDEQRQDARVALEPAFGKTDPIVFATPVDRPKFTVTFQFPAGCVGRRVTVSTDASGPLAAETVLQQAEWPAELKAGSYVVFVPELSIFQAFSVTGGGSDAIVTIR